MRRTERILNRKNLINFGFFTLFFHAVSSMLTYFFNVGWLLTVDYVLLGIMAAATIIYLAHNRIPIRLQPAQVLLIALTVWYIISCISMTVTYENDWVNANANALLHTAVALFLAFPLGYVWIRDRKNGTNRPDTNVPVGQTDLTPLSHLLMLGWTVFIAVVLITVFQGGQILTSNGGMIRMKTGLELNCHYNTTGAWEMIFFLGCFCMIFLSKKLPLKIIYGVSAVIHYVALTLSNSRTSNLSTLAGFMILVAVLVYLWLKKQKNPHPIIIAIIAAVLAGAAFYLLSGPVFKLYNGSTHSKASSRSTIAQVASNTTFTGRTTVWKCAIQGIFSSFRSAVFGVTPISVPEMLNQVSGKEWNWYTHNQFLEVAASIGIPGLIIFVAWFVVMVKDAYKLIFVQKDRTLFLFVPVLLLALMIANMLEAYLVFTFYLSGFVFFLLCGMLHGKVNDPIQASTETRQMIRNRLRKGQKQKRDKQT